MPVTNAQDMAKAGSLINSDGTTVSVAADLLIADKLVHTGDTNTAIRFPANDTVTVETSGTERMRIDSSGRVGIGDTNPIVKLQIRNDGITGANNYLQLITSSDSGKGVWQGIDVTNRLFYFKKNDSNDYAYDWQRADGTSYLRIDSSGNVGIGTSSPRGRLEVPSTLLSGETGAQCIFPLTVTIGYGGNDYGSIGYNLDYRSATNNTTGVKYLASATISQLDFNAGGFIFRNAPSGTGGNTATLTERLRIDSSGNVGIGNTSPSSYNSSADNLVIGNAGDNGITIVSGTDGKGYLFFADGVSGANAYAGHVDFDHSVNALRFGVLGTERLRITSGGNVEIGATGKSAKLLVQSEAGNSQCVYFIHDTALEDVLSLASTPTSGNNMFIQFYTEANAATSRGYIDYNRGSSVVRYSTTSDETLKNIIGDSSGEESVNILKNTKIRDFTWKNDTTNKVNVGVIAQELYNVFKGAVSVGGDIVKKDSDGNDVTTYQPWGVDKTAFTFHLVAGWQAHEKLIQELKSENDSLKARITALEAA